MEKYEFTAEEYRIFMENCNFSEEEKKIIFYRRKGDLSLDGIALALNSDKRTISKKIQGINRKITREIMTWDTGKQNSIKPVFKLDKWKKKIFGGE